MKMGWTIILKGRDGEVVKIPRYEDELTRPLKDVKHFKEARLSLTHNYVNGFNFQKELHGKKARTTLECLENIVSRLGTQYYPDFWCGCSGNVGRACSKLFLWAKFNPEATWDVT